MPILDLRTVMISYICGNLICAIVLVSLWVQNRKRYSGLGYWAVGFVCNLFGITLLSGRGILPDFFSMLLGSLFMVSGMYFLYKGLEIFLRNHKPAPHIFIFMLIYLFLQVYFIYVKPNFGIRNILFSGMLITFSIQFAWLFNKQVDASLRKLTGMLGMITSLFGVLAVIRIILNILVYPGSDPLHSTNYEAYLNLAGQMLYIVLTISLFMLVNRRLQADLVTDIKKREVIEDALRLSQEKFARAFQASPNSILITRISDGKIIDVNDRFTEVTGFTHDEVIDKTTMMFNFWVNPDDRNRVVQEMRQKLFVRNMQSEFRVKSGSTFRGEVSSEYIKLGDDDCMLSVIQDVTERMRMEDFLHLRLKLWEYSLTHNAIEVMINALDAIEDITGSQIGFYHLVEEDSNSLALQAWSTRTKNEYCHAEGSGMHYSIDQAGVWVDCIRERKTVIHNDYASLPNKHGLPEGHSILRRELLVPIFQKDQIVSVLGVGNKPTEYDHNDADLVEYIANLVWSIVSQKRADEKIQLLNKKLADLAMIDELTKLSNRRAFFMRGTEEISRAKRYQTPLSMLMMDIDRFKSINDTYGHAFGDIALQCFAKTLREQVREVDVPARLGGEEFGILLPNTKLDEAQIIAERVRHAIELLRCEKDDDVFVTMTASIGAAEFVDKTKNLDDLFSSADTAMYKAKNNGRNRVEVFEPVL